LKWDAFHAPSVNIPGQGWFLFDDIASQKLVNLNSSWENGPASPGFGQAGCAVQVRFYHESLFINNNLAHFP
jgi:hypothetical protein